MDRLDIVVAVFRSFLQIVLSSVVVGWDRGVVPQRLEEVRVQWHPFF